VVFVEVFSADVELLSIFEDLGLAVLLQLLEILGDEFFFELGNEELILRMGILFDEGEVSDETVSEDVFVV
jgi:hypothetical protein